MSLKNDSNYKDRALVLRLWREISQQKNNWNWASYGQTSE